MLLIGFQLGNTGVMLGAIRDSVPRRRIGTVMAVFGAAGPIGFAVGPILGGVIIDRLGWGIPAVFTVSAGLSVGTALLVGLGSREVRPEVVPAGRVLPLAFGAVRGVIADVPTRRIFAIFFVAFLANQMTRPYVPVLVGHANGPGRGERDRARDRDGRARRGALRAARRLARRPDRVPLGARRVARRVGHRGPRDAASPRRCRSSPSSPSSSARSYATVAPMVFALLGTEVPPERRSQTLNLVYLPLYLGGIVGAEEREDHRGNGRVQRADGDGDEGEDRPDGARDARSDERTTAQR